MHATLFKLHGITYKRQFFLQQPFLWCWLLWASTMRKREFADKMPVSQQMPLTAKILGFQLGLWDHLVLYWNRLKSEGQKEIIWHNCLINPEYLIMIVFCQFQKCDFSYFYSALDMAEILLQVPFTTWLFSRWRSVCWGIKYLYLSTYFCLVIYCQNTCLFLEFHIGSQNYFMVQHDYLILNANLILQK